MIALKPTIKIGNKEIEVESITIDNQLKSIKLTCQTKSFSIFETWKAISDAHHQSDDYAKKNICMDIEISDDVFKSCQVINCERQSDACCQVIIIFDYCVVPIYSGCLCAGEAIAEMNKLFN